MKDFLQCMLVLVLFMVATVAVLEVDRRCKAMTSYGGEITASADLLAEKAAAAWTQTGIGED